MQSGIHTYKPPTNGVFAWSIRGTLRSSVNPPNQVQIALKRLVVDRGREARIIPTSHGSRRTVSCSPATDSQDV